MKQRTHKKLFPVVVEKDEDGFFVATNTTLDITSQGKTIEEALANVREATELYLEDSEDSPSDNTNQTQVSVHLIAA